MKIFRYIGITCISFVYGWYHPIKTKVDILMIVLFWVGMTFFVKSYEED